MIIQNEYLIVGDTEGYYDKFRLLMANSALKIPEKVSIILIGDIVGHGPGRLETLQHCFENQERIKIILGNKDLLAQRLIKGEKMSHTPQWAEKFLLELEKYGTPELQDYFMNGFINYIELWNRFHISHTRLIKDKKAKKHTQDEIVGNRNPNNRPLNRKGKIMIYGHYATDGARINNKGPSGSVSSIGIDSGCGKGKNLSGLLITKGSRSARFIDSGGVNLRIDL